VDTALDIDRAQYAAAQRLAEQGAELARESGLQAQGMAVAEELETTVAQALVRVARDRAAAVIVVGAHGHSRLGEMFLGSTSREVVRHAPCPVLVVRGAETA
jgi:nucleotide-binding universal stress UspA family protein